MSASTDPAKHVDDQHNHHHGHHHEHNHQHEHHNDTSIPSHDDRNIAHWNKVAKTYNSKHTQEKHGDLINKATAFVLANISSIGVDFLDPSTTFEDTTTSTNNATTKMIRVLDYACGPGTITNILAGRVTEFIGMDISPGMVAEYNERFSSMDSTTQDSSTTPTTTDSNSTAEKLNAKAYHANLFAPLGPTSPSGTIDLTSPQFNNFNLVAVGFGYHHFEDLPLVTSRLVERLAPNGVLMILDFFSHAKDEVIDDESVNTIAHHGFTEAQVKGLFGGVGLVDVKVLPFGEEVIMGSGKAKRWPFMAVGRKEG